MSALLVLIGRPNIDLYRPLGICRVKMVREKSRKDVHNDKMLSISRKSMLRKSLGPYTLERPCLNAAHREGRVGGAALEIAVSRARSRNAMRVLTRFHALSPPLVKASHVPKRVLILAGQVK